MLWLVTCEKHRTVVKIAAALDLPSMKVLLRPSSRWGFCRLPGAMDDGPRTAHEGHLAQQRACRQCTPRHYANPWLCTSLQTLKNINSDALTVLVMTCAAGRSAVKLWSQLSRAPLLYLARGIQGQALQVGLAFHCVEAKLQHTLSAMRC